MPPRRRLAVEGFPEVIFVDENQREKFVRLVARKFRDTKWLSKASMVKLGLHAELGELFFSTGTNAFYTMRELSYKSLTCEFLSSLYYDYDASAISFRLFNVDYRLDLVTLGEHLGMQWDEDAYVEIPRHHNPNALWTCITGKTEMNTSSLHISDVSHPVLRFWLRTMNETLFSRTEPGNANLLELAMLDAHLNVERKARFTLFLPHFFARHLVSIVNNPRKEISIGGF